MRITFKEITREFAEEYYYVLINQKSLLHRPSQKISRATRMYLIYLIISLIWMIGSIVLACFIPDITGFVVIPCVSFIIMIFTYRKILQAVQQLANGDPHKFALNMTDAHLIYELGENQLLLTWPNVQQIIITANSVIFLSTDPHDIPICVPSSAASKIKAQAKKLKKTKLIIES